MTVLRARLLLSLGASLTFACSSATVPDVGESDGGFRADAPGRDATPAPDAAPGPELAGALDALPGDAPASSPDAQADAGADPDGGAAPDAADPCGPLPRTSGPARFGDAFGEWLARCNPELTPGEVTAASALVVGLTGDAFTNNTITYDDVAGGTCSCAIANAPCDNLRLLRTIPSCDAAFVTTSTVFDDCYGDLDCPSRTYCEHNIDLVRPGIAFGGIPLPQCGPGQCYPFAAVGESCVDRRCAPGAYCEDDGVSLTCAAKRAIGDDCSQADCLGDDGDVLVFPTAACRYDKGSAECRARGRSNAVCNDGVTCHDLYRCLDQVNCTLAPGENDACALPYDVAQPTSQEAIANMQVAYTTCRFPAVLDQRGMYCTQTGTTTGDATCRSLPQLGQPCGIGQNLAPLCATGAHCPGVNLFMPAPYMATCIPQLVRGSTCTPEQSFSISSPCQAGSACEAFGKSSDYECVESCSSGPGPL